MIVIKSGEIQIPDEDLFIGFAGDNLHSTRQFELTDIGDTNCKHKLYLTFDDATTKHFDLDSKVEDGSTYLTWNIEAEHVLKGGLVKARIKSINNDGIIYHSPSMYFIASPLENNTSDNSNLENTLTPEYKELIDEISDRINGLDEEFVPATRKIAEIGLSSDISAEELQQALHMYPILSLGSAPTTQTVGKLSQLGSVIHYDGSKYYVDMYICRGVKNNGEYAWSLIGEKSITDTVKKYLQENTVEVDGYISVDNIVTTIDENSTDEQVPSAKAVMTYVDSLFESIVNGNEVAY